MFLITGAILGVAGVGSLILVGIFMLCGVFREYHGLEYWLSLIGAVIRNGLMAAAGYAAFKLPMAAPALAWAALGAYVSLTVGLQWVKKESFRVGDLNGTFYVTALFISLCAALLTVLQPPNA